MSEFGLVTVDFGNGERLPLLIRKSTRLGDFDAATYALSLRDRGLKAKTIESAVRAVLILYEVLQQKGVSLYERTSRGELLTQAEVNAISDRCKTRADALDDPALGVISLANARRKKARFIRSKDEAVSSKTAKIRLLYIIDFLKNFSDRMRLQKVPPRDAEFQKVSDLVIKALSSKKPTVPKGSDRRGIPEEAQARLFQVTHPDFAGNPWKTNFLRKRNYLILRLLLELGIRKGELLGIKLDDINLRAGLIFIAKRTNDIDDERTRPATTKTLPRLLTLNDELVKLVLEYLEGVRSTRRLAETHPYLIVSDEGGALAINGVDYVFSSLRASYPEFVKICAHILRHTTNDRFKKLCEGMDPDLVTLIQNYLMGWTKNSDTSRTYTKGYVEKKAMEVFMRLQGKIFQ
ncbi:site-specific integrase [Pseudoduganella umbonata]|uniref:Integrase n=1 Tax=Pseudoduganella umbonata TaxID=864828 RepID=A0A4P8HUD2_9BURK|nr:site-specific integrase [Pseudoduganella umbonata]MBB3222119.1 integrase [Pseudoduganella umbonata]QCP12358.1 site-specific integrase [Pseudoduganella umbonata]